MNSAMANATTLSNELDIANSVIDPVPLYFDVKGNQLRVREAQEYSDHLELTLNHPIQAKTPTVVLFKAGADYAVLDRIVDQNHLVFQGGPHYRVKQGESLHIRNAGLKVLGPQFCDYEVGNIEKAMKAGIRKYFLSFVKSQRDIDEFREYVGDSEIIAKIEDVDGLRYVASEFKPQPNLSLMAARGDLYVEIDKPHQIMEALKLIIKKDPQAYVGSRILLSVIHEEVPSCADFLEMAWLYDQGYHKMMLCDELCLKENLLGRAINAFESFKRTYDHEPKIVVPAPKIVVPPKSLTARILGAFKPK